MRGMMHVNHESKKLKLHNTMQVCEQCGYQTGGICDMCGNVTQQYENIESVALHLHSQNDIQQNTSFTDGEIKIQVEASNFDLVSDESESTAELNTYDSLGVLTQYVSEDEHKLDTVTCTNTANRQVNNEICVADTVTNTNNVYSHVENTTATIVSNSTESATISKKCDSTTSSTAQLTIATTQSNTLKTSSILPKPSSAPKSLGSMINKMVHHCTKCSEKFLELNQCLDHFKKVHSITEDLESFSELKSCSMYQCSLCCQRDNLFFSLDVLAKHVQLHGIKRDVRQQQAPERVVNDPLECEVCLAKFPSSALLSEHTQKISFYVFSMASRSIFFCKLCNKYYFIFKLFQNHFHRRHKSHTKFLFREKVQKIFECSACKSTGPKYHLNRKKFELHLRTAHGLVLGVTGKSACVASPCAVTLQQPAAMTTQSDNCGNCDAAFVLTKSCVKHVEHEHGLMVSEGENQVLTVGGGVCSE